MHQPAPNFLGASLALKTTAKKYFWLVSDTRLAQRRLGDPSLVLQLKLQFFNHLSQAFSREGICGLQGQPTSLLQFPLQCLAPHACHFRVSCLPDRVSKVFTDSFTLR